MLPDQQGLLDQVKESFFLYQVGVCSKAKDMGDSGL